MYITYINGFNKIYNTKMFSHYNFLKYLYIVIIILLFIGFVQTLENKFVIILSRHGARGIYYPNYDPTWNKNQYFELTEVGMRQHYILGVQFRHEYPQLFQNITPQEILVQSYDNNRVIASSAAQMTGIFENRRLPMTDHIRNMIYSHMPYKKIQKVKDLIFSNNTEFLEHITAIIHTRKADNDGVLGAYSSKLCKTNSRFIRSNLKSLESHKFEKEMEPTLNYLKEISGKMFDIRKAEQLYDTLNCDLYKNKTFYKYYSAIKFGSDIWRNLTFIHYYQFFLSYAYDKPQITLLTINFLNELLEHMLNYINKTSKIKFVSYLGRDMNLIPLLAAFNITTMECLRANFLNHTANLDCKGPEFAASLKWELYSIDRKYFVKMYYNGYGINICKSQDGSCTFENFIIIIKEITKGFETNDYHTICNFDSSKDLDEIKNIIMNNNTSNWIKTIKNVLIYISGLLFIITIIVYTHFSKRMPIYHKKFKSI